MTDNAKKTPIDRIRNALDLILALDGAPEVDATKHGAKVPWVVNLDPHAREQIEAALALLPPELPEGAVEVARVSVGLDGVVLARAESGPITWEYSSSANFWGQDCYRDTTDAVEHLIDRARSLLMSRVP